ncbi:MAG TPA: hypothetical protein VL651_16405 [Bacteroidia bacterium]|nr:hypothetical protein [Bacteroidia bacterium]
MLRLPTSIFLLLSSIFLFPANGFSQHNEPLPLILKNVDASWDWRSNHTSIQPILEEAYHPKKDSSFGDGGMAHFITGPPRLSFANYYQKPFSDTDHFVEGGKTAFLIRPIYDLSGGKDLKSKNTIFNSAAGVILDADYKQKIGIEARFVTGISSLPYQLDSFAHFSGMMPGYSDRAYALGNGNYAFQHFSGNIIYRPSKIFNIQIGRDKHFWGDGYRSLFLSDCGMAMPYLKMQTTIWKLQYTSLFTWMQDWTNSNGFAKDFRSKFGTFHYIDFNATKWLNLGVFESIIFQGNDNLRMRGFDPNYLNPIIFYRPVEYSLGSSDNAMLGLSLKIRFNRNNIFYSQIILDEFYLKEIKAWKNGWWANKQGIQMGYKMFNVGNVNGLNMQMEMNIVRPYTYTHGSPQQNYSNAGMPLAHPLGANFAEGLGILSYYHKGFSISGKMVMAAMGLDSAGKNYGQNIFLPYGTRSVTTATLSPAADYNHHIFDGTKTILFSAELTSAYRFNTSFPLRVELTAGVWALHQYGNGVKKQATAVNKSSYIQLGLCLPLWRTYRDY